jgi:hypothetical protein
MLPNRVKKDLRSLENIQTSCDPYKLIVQASLPLPPADSPLSRFFTFSRLALAVSQPTNLQIISSVGLDFGATEVLAEFRVVSTGNWDFGSASGRSPRPQTLDFEPFRIEIRKCEESHEYCHVGKSHAVADLLFRF